MFGVVRLITSDLVPAVRAVFFRCALGLFSTGPTRAIAGGGGGGDGGVGGIFGGDKHISTIGY